MEENLHDIDKLFRSSVDGYEEAPPENVWDAVNAGLDKSSIISIKKKYTNLKRVAVALLILLLGTIAYEIGTRSGGGAGKDEVNNGGKVDKVNKVDGVDKGGSEEEVNKVDKVDEVNTVDKGDKVNGGDEVNKVDKVDKVDNGSMVDKDKYKLNRRSVNDIQDVPGKIIPSNNNKTQLAKQDDPLDKQNLPGNNKKQRNKNNTTHQVVINLINPGQEDTNDNADDNGTSGKNKRISRSQRLMAENLQVEKAQYTGALPVLRKLPPTPVMAYQPAAEKKVMMKKESPTSRFTLGVFYGPQFSSNRLENDHHDDRRGPGQPPGNTGNDKDDIKNDEQRQSAYSFGISVEYAVGKNWAVESGLALLNKKIQIEPKKIYAKADANGEVKYRFDCSSGYSYLNPKTSTAPTVGDSISVSESENTLQYLTVPVAVKYKLNLGKFTISPTVGAAANFVTKQKISTEYTVASVKQSQTINNIEGLKPVYYSGIAGVSLDYKLKKNISVSVMPSGNFALSSINKNAAVRSYPNAFGLSFGLKIKL